MAVKKVTDIKEGETILLDGKQCKVKSKEHTKPGKGGAFFKIEAVNIETGEKVAKRVPSTDSLPVVFIQKVKLQLLYLTEDTAVFLDIHSQEEITALKHAFTEDQWSFLPYCDKVEMKLNENNECLSAELPDIQMKVISASPYIKGSSAKLPDKPVVLENNTQVLAPRHIESGDEIVVNPNTMTFVKRV